MNSITEEEFKNFQININNKIEEKKKETDEKIKAFENRLVNNFNSINKNII